MKSLFIEKPDIVDFHDPLETFWFMDICPLDENFIISFASKAKASLSDLSDYATLHFVSRHANLSVRELGLLHYVFKTLLLDYIPHPQARLFNQDIFINDSALTSYRLEKGFNEYFFHVECHMELLNEDYSLLKDNEKLSFLKNFSTKSALDFCHLLGQFDSITPL